MYIPGRPDKEPGGRKMNNKRIKKAAEKWQRFSQAAKALQTMLF